MEEDGSEKLEPALLTWADPIPNGNPLKVEKQKRLETHWTLKNRLKTTESWRKKKTQERKKSEIPNHTKAL